MVVRTPGTPLTRRLRPYTDTIFATMSGLATATGSVNLGQGFPDSDGPPDLLADARRAIADGFNQYPPGPGLPVLREAVAAARWRDHGHRVDPATEVLITVGATEAIAAAMLALCEPGDEVVLLQPCYDSYPPAVAMAGGVPRFVTLRPDATGRFGLDPDELRAAIGPRTRLLVVNSPHNPTGTVLTAMELTAIAGLAVEHDLLVVTDEVYEHMVFDGGRHIALATLPGMADRTLSVSSAGKTFSVTGWKIGWVCGPAALVDAVRAAKQFLTFTAGTPFQLAVAAALGRDGAWVAGMRADLQRKRDRLCVGLEAAGLPVIRPQGTYFVVADIRALGEDDGLAFCLSLPHRVGVVAVPVQVFYDDPAAGRPFVRFAFCKADVVLDEAVERLRSLSR